MAYHCLLFNAGQEMLYSRYIGSHRIATVLREQGWDAEVVDMVPYWSLSQLKIFVRSRITADTKFIGLSFLWLAWTPLLESFAQWFKKTYPDIPIIAGLPVKQEFGTRTIDYYVQGFGEVAAVELLKYLFSNGPRPKFEVLPHEGGKIIRANDAYPAFPMRSLKVIYEDRDFIEPGEWLTIEFARGCKFACDFCSFPVIGVKGDYTRDAEDFRHQVMDAYDRFGVVNYIASDETFNDRTEKITKFADVVETLPFKPWFGGFIRPDLLFKRARDREELGRMNFLGQYYGIESFNRTAGKAIHKSMDPDLVKQGLLDIRKYYQDAGRPYRGTVSMMVGLPGESVQDLKETNQWLLDNWRDQSVIWHDMTIITDEGHRKSAIAADPEKYGYSVRERDPERDKPGAMDMFSKIEWMPWKNEFMDVYQAKELRDQFKMDAHENFRLQVWALSALAFPGYLNIEDRLELTGHDAGRYIMDSMNVPSKYIRKKIDHIGK